MVFKLITPAKKPKKRGRKPPFINIKKRTAAPSDFKVTENLVMSAIDGTLAKQHVLGDPDQDALLQVGAHHRPSGRPLGITTGLPITFAICYILQRNEQRIVKLTDDQITKWLLREFPGRNTKRFNAVQDSRRKFNTGRYTRRILPTIQSHRYDGGSCLDDPTPGRGRKPAPKPFIDVDDED